MSTGGKRAKSVANPGGTDKVFNKLGYFERQTDDWGDTFVLRVQEVATNTYVSVESERATDMRLTDMRLTDTSNGTSTDTYVVAVLSICTLISYFLLSHICRCFGLYHSLGGYICGDSYEGWLWAGKVIKGCWTGRELVS